MSSAVLIISLIVFAHMLSNARAESITLNFKNQCDETIEVETDDTLTINAHRDSMNLSVAKCQVSILAKPDAPDTGLKVQVKKFQSSNAAVKLIMRDKDTKKRLARMMTNSNQTKPHPFVTEGRGLDITLHIPIGSRVVDFQMTFTVVKRPKPAAVKKVKWYEWGIVLILAILVGIGVMVKCGWDKSRNSRGGKQGDEEDAPRQVVHAAAPSPPPTPPPTPPPPPAPAPQPVYQQPAYVAPQPLAYAPTYAPAPVVMAPPMQQVVYPQPVMYQAPTYAAPAYAAPAYAAPQHVDYTQPYPMGQQAYI